MSALQFFFVKKISIPLTILWVNCREFLDLYMKEDWERIIDVIYPFLLLWQNVFQHLKALKGRRLSVLSLTYAFHEQLQWTFSILLQSTIEVLVFVDEQLLGSLNFLLICSCNSWKYWCIYALEDQVLFTAIAYVTKWSWKVRWKIQSCFQ